MSNTVSMARIEELIDSCTEKFHHFEGTTTTVCALFLPSGFMLAVGQSACVDPRNFDDALGKRIAASDARRKGIEALWQFEGYALRCRLDDSEE